MIFEGNFCREIIYNTIMEKEVGRLPLWRVRITAKVWHKLDTETILALDSDGWY